MCACLPVLRGLRHLLVRGAVRACVVGPGLLSRPATPGSGVGVCVCLCVRFACTPLFLGGVCCVGVCAGLGFRLRPVPLGWVVGVCVRSCVCPACPRPSWGAACGIGVCGCCRWWGLPPPSPLVFFFGGGLCGVGRWLSRCWVLRPLSPRPFTSRPRCLFFFPSQRRVCPRVLGVASPGGPLPWCCRLWLGGPPPPLWGVLSSVLSGWGVWPPLVVLVDGWVAVNRSRPPPCFLGGGPPVPPSAFTGLAHALVGILCGFPVCCWWLRFVRPCPGSMRRLGYAHDGLDTCLCWVTISLCRVGACARRLRVALG